MRSEGKGKHNVNVINARSTRPSQPQRKTSLVQPADSIMASGSDSDLASPAKRMYQPGADQEGECPGLAPPFDSTACGDRCNGAKAEPWGRNGRTKFPCDYWSRQRNGTPSIAPVKEFLRIRMDRNGQSILNKLEREQPHANGWWKLL